MNGHTHHYQRPNAEHSTMPPEVIQAPQGLPKEHLYAHDVNVPGPYSDRPEEDDFAQERPDPRVQQMRTLSTWDVAALIANKMIGTGIFTGPTAVLRYTLNKNVAIGLWTLGFLYTLLR